MSVHGVVLLAIIEFESLIHLTLRPAVSERSVLGRSQGRMVWVEAEQSDLINQWFIDFTKKKEKEREKKLSY